MRVRGVALDDRHGDGWIEPRQPVGERRAHDAAADDDYLIAQQISIQSVTGLTGLRSYRRRAGGETGRICEVVLTLAKSLPAPTGVWSLTASKM